MPLQNWPSMPLLVNFARLPLSPLSQNTAFVQSVHRIAEYSAWPMKYLDRQMPTELPYGGQLL